MTAGTTAAYVVSITNTGPDTAHNVSLVESIPAGATTLSMLQQTGTKSFTISQVTGGYTATAPMLPVGQSATFEVRVSIPPDAAGGTMLVNTATASSGMPDSNLANNTRSVSSTVQTVSDLVITKTTESPSPVLAGTELTYRLQIENRGPSDAAMVKVNDVLPAAVTFVSAAVTDGDEWLKSEPPEGGTGTVDFSKNSMAAGETASFEIVVKINPNLAPNTRLSNTATVSSASQAPTPANGSDTAAITVSTSSDVSITKESSPKPPATVAPGGTIEYTLKVRNDGPSNARQVRVTDVVPAGTRFVSATVEPNTGWAITSKPSPGSTGSVVFSNSQLASGAETILTVVVKVNPTVAHGTVIRNTATIGSSISPGSTAQPTPDSDPGNNSATVETTVGPPPASLAIARGATPGSMTAVISSRS